MLQEFVRLIYSKRLTRDEWLILAYSPLGLNKETKINDDLFIRGIHSLFFLTISKSFNKAAEKWTAISRSISFFSNAMAYLHTLGMCWKIL